MNTESVTLATSAATLKSLITAAGHKAVPDECVILIVQAPTANGGIAYFGDSAKQTFELAAGDPFYYVPGEFVGGRINLNDIYFKTDNAGDKLSVMWVPYGEES